MNVKRPFFLKTAALCACILGLAVVASTAAPDPTLPEAAPGASPSPSPSPTPAPPPIPKPAPETESTDVNATQAGGAQMEQAPETIENATPENEAQREGLLQPESGLQQQITEGEAVYQPLFNKPKPLSTRQYEFDLGMSEIFDDNIFLSSGGKQSDFITTISPAMKLQLGDFTNQELSYLVVGYIPSFIIFADHSHEDAIDSDASLDGQWTPSKLTFGLNFRFQHLSGSEIEIGERVRRNVYNGAFTTKYDFSDKASVEADFYEQTLDYDSQYVSSTEWSTKEWFNYHYTPAFTLSVGAAFGYVTVQNAGDQYYEQLLGRATYNAAAKVAFIGSAGLELREFSGGGIPSKFTPVFSIGVDYKPFQETDVVLEAFRRVEYSALFVGDDYTDTGFDLTLSQRLTSRFLILGEGGYTYTDYQSANKNLSPVSAYSYFYLKPEISYEFTNWLKSDIFYEIRDKASSQNGQSFTDNQIGIEGLVTF